MKKHFVAAFVPLLLLSTRAGADENPACPTNRNAAVTLAVFMNDAGDPELEDALRGNIGQLAARGSSKLVNVVIQFRGHRYFVAGGTKKLDPTVDEDAEALARRWGTPLDSACGGIDLASESDALNITSGAAVRSFVKMVQSRFVASRMVLVIGTHGTGARGLPGAPDRASSPMGGARSVAGGTPGERLHMLDLERAVRGGIADARGKPFDVLAFDACLMSTIEVAYGLRDSARIMVAPESDAMGEGFPYSELREWLHNNLDDQQSPSDLTGDMIAAALRREYRKKRVHSRPSLRDLSVVTQSRVSSVAAAGSPRKGAAVAVQRLGWELAQAVGDPPKPAIRDQILRARQQCQSPTGAFFYVRSGTKSGMSVDIECFCTALMQSTAESLASARAAARSACNDVKDSLQRPAGQRTDGLTVYFPPDRDAAHNDVDLDAYDINADRPPSFVGDDFPEAVGATSNETSAANGWRLLVRRLFL